MWGRDDGVSVSSLVGHGNRKRGKEETKHTFTELLRYRGRYLHSSPMRYGPWYVRRPGTTTLRVSVRGPEVT